MTELAIQSETPTSRRLINVVGLLLILQALGILALAGYLLYAIDWEVESQAFIQSEQAIDAVVFGICFIPVAIALVLVSIAFLLVSQRAWVLAILMQGLLLGGCLYLYFIEPGTEIGHTYYIYAIMLSGVLLLLYLNSAHVRLFFQKRRSLATETEHQTENQDEPGT